MRERCSQLPHGGRPIDMRKVGSCSSQFFFGAVAGFLDAPLYLHQDGNQKYRGKENRESQNGSLSGLRQIPPQKKAAEGERGESNGEQTRPQTSEEVAHRNSEKETRRGGIDGPRHLECDSTATIARP
jgi:hypothetical protein